MRVQRFNDELDHETRRVLGIAPDAAMLVDPIFEGASDRAFYRIGHGSDSWILVSYGDEKQENLLYVPIARFLNDLGVPVPRVVSWDEKRHLVWTDDLGTESLFFLRNFPWRDREPRYQSALKGAHRLHEAGLAQAEAIGLELVEGYDAALYKWEQDYFLNELVAGAFGQPVTAGEDPELENEIERIAADLLAAPPCLIHRDFQSQNVLIRDGQAAFIDFQGMRRGCRFYDLASLLYDPYVEIGTERRHELLRYYYALPREGNAQPWADFQRIFHLAGAQRLMQALGAYGFLGLKAKKRDFLGHIPAALRHLEEACRLAGDLPHLYRLAESLLHRYDDLQLAG